MARGGTSVGKQTKFILPEDRIPRAWYNIAADLPVPLPPARTRDRRTHRPR